MKFITTDCYTFSKLIRGNFVYVDKTGILRELLRPASAQYFMARPRRFGKSLTISTLECIFKGERELFKGLAIDKSDYDWKTYPVVRLDMGSCAAETVDQFWSHVQARLIEVSEQLQTPLRERASVCEQFQFLLQDIAQKSPTRCLVLLIDEYDKPLINRLGQENVDEFRTALKQFYSVIKTYEHLQRFTFLTGVSKFSKVSIFSDLNNLIDLTMTQDAALLCGYTHEEVKANFPEHIHCLARENGMTSKEAFNAILKWYDGYRFHPRAEQVVNPVSLGRCLSQKEFKSFWYETATPTFLINELTRVPLDISDLEVSESDLGNYEPSHPDIVPLLYQTGYLTIKAFYEVDEDQIVRLGFPNEEVLRAFNKSLWRIYSGVQDKEFPYAKTLCFNALRNHDLKKFFETVPFFFANIPYDLTDKQNEQTWQAILVVILHFLGFRVVPEERTNRGRIDVKFEGEKELYLVELKLDHPASEALAQIKEKGYPEKFAVSSKRLTLIGIEFSSTKRTIVDWVAEVQ